MTDPRRFARGQRAALYLIDGGRCSECGSELAPGWHADHVFPHSRGGATDVTNGQALCPDCNLKKGSKMAVVPRGWQRRFLAKYHAYDGENFLLVACPGAGKTFAAGFAIGDHLRDHTVDRVLIVVPSRVLREQWMAALAIQGVAVDGLTRNNEHGERTHIDGQSTHGWVVTYQSLAEAAHVHRALNGRKRTLVVLDEVHHLGDDLTWGSRARYALEPCVRRLCLSGTPFRTDRTAIPFVQSDGEGYCRYRDDPETGEPFRAGYDYSYGTALADNPSPVRRIVFDYFDGDAQWLSNDKGDPGEGTLSNLDLKKETRRKVNRHILNAGGDWLRDVLDRADERLTLLQRDGDPSAKGLVLCIDTDHAADVHALLAGIVGPDKVAVAVSRDTEGNDRTEEARSAIEQFRIDQRRWLVAVQMVSEGVDIPALRVAVYATNRRAPLFFRQAIGRVVRLRPDLEDDVDQTAFVYVPKDPGVMELADGIQEEIKVAVLARAEADDDPGRPEQVALDLGDEFGGPSDKFVRSEIGEAGMLLPGAGSVDPDRVRLVAGESGQPIGVVADVLAAIARLGVFTVATPTEQPRPAPDPYVARLKTARRDLEGLFRGVAGAVLRRDGGDFGEIIARLKSAIYLQAGIYSQTDRSRSAYERADISQLEEASLLIRKAWGEL